MEKLNLQILIVEDNPGDAFLLNHHLQMIQLVEANIYEANSMQNAQKALRSQPPDIVFLDLFLPDSRGIETFTSINRLLPDVPIIILSGLSDTDTALSAIQNGAQDFLTKGEFDENTLSKSIYYSIERKKIQRRLKQSLQMHELVGRATNDLIWDWNLRTNRVKHLSKAIYATYGYTADQVGDNIGWWYGKVHPNDIRKLEQVIVNALAKRAHKCVNQFRLKCANGKYKFIYGRAYLLYDEDNKPYRIIAALQDITALKRLQQQVTNEKTIRQQKITEATIRSQEKEREEIGKELHDNINQILATSKMFIDIALKKKEMRDELLPKSFEYLNTAIEEIRRMSKSLVPPSLGDLGLKEAVSELIEAYENMGIVMQFNYQKQNDENVSEAIQLMIYRIIQEGITNALKHAKPTKIIISLLINETSLQVYINDNGIGFVGNNINKGIGLRNIKSRAALYGGKMKLSSNGNGTTLAVSIPL